MAVVPGDHHGLRDRERLSDLSPHDGGNVISPHRGLQPGILLAQRAPPDRSSGRRSSRWALGPSSCCHSDRLRPTGALRNGRRGSADLPPRAVHHRFRRVLPRTEEVHRCEGLSSPAKGFPGNPWKPPDRRRHDDATGMPGGRHGCAPGGLGGGSPSPVDYSEACSHGWHETILFHDGYTTISGMLSSHFECPKAISLPV